MCQWCSTGSDVDVQPSVQVLVTFQPKKQRGGDVARGSGLWVSRGKTTRGAGYLGDQGNPWQLCMSVCPCWCVQEGLIQQLEGGHGLRDLYVLVCASTWGDWGPGADTRLTVPVPGCRRDPYCTHTHTRMYIRISHQGNFMLVNQRGEQVEAAGAVSVHMVTVCMSVLLCVDDHVGMCCRWVALYVPLGNMF